MKEITKDYKPRKSDSLLFRELEDGGAIYDPETEQLHTLNSTAAYIWVLCTGEFTVEDIIVQLAHDFDKKEVDIKDQVFQAIKKFIENDLLEE